MSNKELMTEVVKLCALVTHLTQQSIDTAEKVNSLLEYFVVEDDVEFVPERDPVPCKLIPMPTEKKDDV